MKPVKIISVGVLAAIAFLVDWILIKLVIYQDPVLAFWAWPVLATILGIVFLTFFFLLNKNYLVSSGLALVIFLGYVWVFPKNLYVILGGIIFLIFILLFKIRLQQESKNTLDFSIRRVLSRSVSVIMYALLLLIGFNVYYNTQEDFKSNPDAYYSKLGQAAARTVPYFTKALPEDVDFSHTLDQFAIEQVQSNDPQLIELYKNQFSRQFSINASGNQTLTDIFAQVVVDKIKKSAQGYEPYFPFIFAIIVTGLLWSFAFVVRWLTVGVGWVIFWIFLAFGFFKLEKEMVEVEKLSI